MRKEGSLVFYYIYLLVSAEKFAFGNKVTVTFTHFSYTYTPLHSYPHKPTIPQSMEACFHQGSATFRLTIFSSQNCKFMIICFNSALISYNLISHNSEREEKSQI